MDDLVNALPSLADLPVVTSAGRIPAQVGWSMGSHVHADYDELIFVVSGKLHVKLGSESVAGLPGQTLHYPAGVVHEEISEGRIETIFVGWQTRGETLPSVATDALGRVESAMRWILSAEPMVRQCLLFSVLKELRSEVTVAGPAQKAIAYMESHLAEPLSLESLADHVGMSRFHFAHEFTREVGVSPMRYLCEQRVRTAQALIARSNVPLRSIAESVGLNNEFNMSRVFRRVCHQPPSHFRRGG